MSKFGWSVFVTLSMISIGTNILIYRNHPAEILQFVGGWLLVGGVGIVLIGVFFEQLVDFADWLVIQYPKVRSWIGKRGRNPKYRP